MIFLAAAGDVDGLGFVVLLGRRALLSTNRERNRTKERNAESERREQASLGELPERKSTLSDYTWPCERCFVPGEQRGETRTIRK